MHYDKPKEIIIITSEGGVWREEKLLLATGVKPLKIKPFVPKEQYTQEKAYSPWQWKRTFKETMSPGYRASMDELRNVDRRIARFSDELNYLLKLLPSDPTRLPDIALVLIEIKQRLDSIVEAGGQVKLPRDKKLSDFYGRFHIGIPENLATASDKSGNKIAIAGLIGDFVHWIGRKIFELTDSEIREMKRVVAHLLNTTKQTVVSINKALRDMRLARKAGDINKYIEGVQFIGKGQVDFKREFSVVYNSYLKAPYEHALALEEQRKKEVEASGKVFAPKYEEVSIRDGKVEVIEVDSPPLEEAAPLETAESAEKSDKEVYRKQQEAYQRLYGRLPEEVSEEQRKKMLEDLKDTRQVEVKPKEDQELAQLIRQMPPPLPAPQIPSGVKSKQEGWPAVQLLPAEMSAEELADTERESSPLPSGRTIRPQIEPSPPTQPRDYGEPKARIRRPEDWDPKTTLRSPKFEGVGGDEEEASTPEAKQPKPKPEWGKHLEDMPPEAILSCIDSSEVEAAITKVAHTRFLSKLAKIAETENKYIVAAFMAKYSKELEDTNPHASAALLMVAQEISND